MNLINLKTIIGSIALLAALTAQANLPNDLPPSNADNADTVEQHRVGLRDSILANIHGAKISEHEFDILNFGAKGDGVKDCLPAFRKAIAKAEKAGAAA